MLSILLFVLVILLTVGFHEYGHYKFAKIFGVRVDEFGIGFPPKILKLGKSGETEFTLNAIPLGGFVKIFGETKPADGEFVEPKEEAKALYSKPLWQQALIVFAGPLANILLTIVLFTIALTIGTYVATPERYGADLAPITIGYVAPESPAEKSGILAGDILMSVSLGQNVAEIDALTDLTDFLGTTSGEVVTLQIKRGEEEKVLNVKPERLEEGSRPTIGVGLDQSAFVRLPIHKAFYYGIKDTLFMTKEIVVFLGSFFGDLFQGTADGDSVTGPIGVAKALGGAVKFGIGQVILFAGFISLNLGIINLLPIPALDGSRLLVFLIEGISRKKLSSKAIGITHSVGFIFLILLMIFVTYKDILRFF